MKSKKINITLEDILSVTQKGFEHIDGRLDTLTIEMNSVKKDIAGVRDDVLRLENIVLRTQDNRVSKLEDDMRVVKTKLNL